MEPTAAPSSSSPAAESSQRGLLRSAVNWRRIAWFVPSLVLLVALGWFALPRFADFTSIWREISAMTYLELGVLVVVAGWNLFTYWAGVVVVTPGLTYRQAMVATEST